MLGSLYRLADFARHQGHRRTMEPDLATGRRGEDIAHRFLQRAGMTVVARNFRTRGGSGEVDLVAWDGDQLVFVEVKTRTSGEYGPPDRAIGPDKIYRIVNASREYARRAGIEWERVRFDTICILLRTPPAIVHHRDVFYESTAVIPY